MSNVRPRCPGNMYQTFCDSRPPAYFYVYTKAPWFLLLYQQSPWTVWYWYNRFSHDQDLPLLWDLRAAAPGAAAQKTSPGRPWPPRLCVAANLFLFYLRMKVASLLLTAPWGLEAQTNIWSRNKSTYEYFGSHRDLCKQFRNQKQMMDGSRRG
jgi:hypothetical protein